MNEVYLPIGEFAKIGLEWLKTHAKPFFDGFKILFDWAINTLADALISTPVPLLIVVFALIGWFLRSWQMALGTAAGFTCIYAMARWESSLQTLSLVLVSALVAIIIAVPLGVLAARNRWVSALTKPILDFMQTMPGFVYLIPAVTFFSIGEVAGMVATIIFALPPGVRLTELGIRSVDLETVEAGHAFGAKPGQILRGIQLPLAMPTIMAGINQVIMLALSMVVLAGIVGANGLGKDVATAVGTQNLALGVEAGLSVVVLAVFLDRVTAAMGTPGNYPRSLRALWGASHGTRTASPRL